MMRAVGEARQSMTGGCPVCRSDRVAAFVTVGEQRYWRCETCLATYLDPAQRPTREEERAHYAHHRNDSADLRYRSFLSRLSIPLLERLAPCSRVLDYGCGPGPALAAMMREAGHDVSLYDPFFVPDACVLSASFDAITCTEVAEHFHAPADEFDFLGALLRPGGWLGVMTCFQTDDARFAAWHYRADPTHVVFYREATLRRLAEARGWSFECPAKDIALMQVPAVA